MAAGDLCYVKGGHALAYSKVSATAGALIYKAGAADYYLVLEFGTTTARWVYSRSGQSPAPMYQVGVDGWTATTPGVAWAQQTTSIYKSGNVGEGTYHVEHEMLLTLSTASQVGTHEAYRYNAIVDTTLVYTVRSYNATTGALVHTASASRVIDYVTSSTFVANQSAAYNAWPLEIVLAADGSFSLTIKETT